MSGKTLHPHRVVCLRQAGLWGLAALAAWMSFQISGRGTLANISLGALIPLVGATVFMVLRALWAALTAPAAEAQALAATEGLPYRHFHAVTGIAVDPARRQLHLLEGRTYKTYGFQDVRSWEGIVVKPGGTVMVGGGLVQTAGVASHDIQRALAAERESGFFVEVRDAETPRWRIAFPKRGRDKALARWMEILRQAINES